MRCEENKLIAKAVKWTVQVMAETVKAGGYSTLFIDQLPPEIISTMVRNNLYIVHQKVKDES